jgi:hypothetical protein
MALNRSRRTEARADAHTAADSRPPARAARRWPAAALAAALLTGCGTAPFVDGRREAGQTTMVGASSPDRVAICYSSRSTTPRAVLALAEAECAKTGRTARFDGQDELRCALLAPTRAFFKCVAK